MPVGKNYFAKWGQCMPRNMQHAIEYGNRLIMLEAGQLRLEMSGAEKTSLDVESLVERFHITDDKILLS